MVSRTLVTRVASPSCSRLSKVLLTLLVLCAPGCVSHGGPTVVHAWAPKEVLSTRDLSSNVYPSVGHTPCVLLVNNTGSVGCSTSGATGVTAPIRAFETLSDLQQRLTSPTIVLLPATAVPEVLQAFIDDETGKPSGWVKHLSGILIEPGVGGDGSGAVGTEYTEATDPSTASATWAIMLAGQDFNSSQSFSLQPRYPQNVLRSVHDTDGTHGWNKNGVDAVSHRFHDVPVVLLDEQGMDVAKHFANRNGKFGESRVAEMRFPMNADDATRLIAHSDDTQINPAKACLAKRMCQPIGGHSIVASVPGYFESEADGSDASGASDDSSDFILVSSKLDASSLFHSVAFGANNGMSGLVVLLTAAKMYTQVLDAAASSDQLPIEQLKKAKPVAFAGFGAEEFGYAGSRRFAKLVYDNTETNKSTEDTEKPSALPSWLRGKTVSQVLDIGAVGFSNRNGFGDDSNVFAHVNPGVDDTTAAELIETLASAFKTSSSTGDDSVLTLKRSSASSVDTSLPPSSLLSFERRDRLVNGLVLAEFDDAFVDSFFGSAFDVGVEAVDVDRISVVAESVTRFIIQSAFKGVEGGGEGDGSYASMIASRISTASVQATTKQLTACLIDPAIGFECPLAQRLFAASETFPSRYAGVAPPSVGAVDWDSDADGKIGLGADDIARFVWEYLAEATSSVDSTSERKKCANWKQCSSGEVCVRSMGDGSHDTSVSSSLGSVDTLERDTQNPRRALLGSDLLGTDGAKQSGVCKKSSARFVPAVSHTVQFDAEKMSWSIEDDDSDSNLEGGSDPTWCESDWPSSTGVRVYRVETSATEWVCLVCGAFVTLGAYFLSKELETIARVRFKEE